jgi:hypothetical protein
MRVLDRWRHFIDDSEYVAAFESLLPSVPPWKAG